MICSRCGRTDGPADRFDGFHGVGTDPNRLLCPECFQEAARELREERGPRYCHACGEAVIQRPESPEERQMNLSGYLAFDCPACGREHLQFPAEAIRVRFDRQPRCHCGYFAKFRGTLIHPPGSGRPEEITLWDCRNCGRELRRIEHPDGTLVTEILARKS